MQEQNKIIVSVICTVYNKGKYLRKTLDSLLNQKTDFGYEIIVVDDVSTDGSREIIEEYAKKYPELIRPYYNEKNLGITLNWIQSCEHALGKYIARIDGDDFWIDEYKLRKQVDLLDKSEDSKWCTTDLNMVDGEDRMLFESCFKNHHISRVDSFEKMLITKGFTCPSAWLVETDLMREVNREIPKDSVDDTFCIQLEMFQRTKIIFMSDVTTNYRCLEESDSHFVDEEKINKRNQKLKESQSYYIAKYPDLDYEAVLKCSIEIQEDFEKSNRRRDESYKKLEDAYKDLEKEYQSVTDSTCWKITKPVRMLMDTLMKRR